MPTNGSTANFAGKTQRRYRYIEVKNLKMVTGVFP